MNSMTKVLRVVECFVLTNTQAPFGRIVGSQELSLELEQKAEILNTIMIVKILKKRVFLFLFRHLHGRPVRFIIVDIMF